MTPRSSAAFKLLTRGITFIVLDIETCPAPDGDHIVSLAAVAIRQGGHRVVFSSLINPGVPITNSQIHGLTDRDVATSRSFADITTDLDSLLGDDDTVLVCHNVAFDVGRLHLEYGRLGTGEVLPDVLVIDSMPLPGAIGYAVPGRGKSLDAYCSHFGITNVRPHDSTSDALATAEVLHELLLIAAAGGHTDFNTFHLITGALSAHMITPAGMTATVFRERQLELPAAHLVTHTKLLGVKASNKRLDEWAAGAAECVKLRCHLLIDKARTANHHAVELHRRLTDMLVADGPSLDAGQGATLVAALNVLARRGLQRGKTTRPYVTWWQHHRQQIGAIEHCDEDAGQCPDCRDGDPCPIDIAHQAITNAICCDETGYVTTDRRKRISDSKTSAFLLSWPPLGLYELAGYAAWLTADAWAADRNPGRADIVIDQAMSNGAYDPRVIRVYAERLTLQGRLSDADALVTNHLQRSTTDPGWAELSLWHDRSLAQRTRRTMGPNAKPGASIRVARPPARVRPNRFSV